MEFHSELNLLLEALAYLGRRAGGCDTRWMLERLRSRGVVDTAAVEERCRSITRLTAVLDRAVKIDEQRLAYLFGNLPGFGRSTIGSYSRGFLMLYPMVASFRGDFPRALEQARLRSPERLAGDLAVILDLAEESGAEPELSAGELSARLIALNIPAETKVAVLELYHRGGEVLEEAMALVQKVAARLRREQTLLEACCADFLREIGEQGPEAVLAQTSALNTDPGRSDVVVPFLFGMDTVLAVSGQRPGPVQVYCGILRRPLQTALASAKGPEVEVYEAIKLLADQTRFDILCYLREHDAYGQELAAKFGLSRNTIHHHMTKLLAAHLVKCTVDGNRVYYRVDERSISRLLDRQRELLLPGK